MSPKIHRDYVAPAAPNTSPARALPWADEARCVEYDPEIWFEASSERHEPKPRYDRIDRAKEICAGCPVRVPCADHALADLSLQGIWGGLTHEERRRMGRR